MKAYKLIWKLLRHPFSDVAFNNFTITHISYNRYLREYDMKSITTKISNNEKVFQGVNSIHTMPMS